MPVPLFATLFIAWFVGVLTDHLFGGALHALLAVCTAGLLTQLVQAKAPLV
jgi:hypothetical protein